jgi:hypothetical protein
MATHTDTAPFNADKFRSIVALLDSDKEHERAAAAGATYRYLRGRGLRFTDGWQKAFACPHCRELLSSLERLQRQRQQDTASIATLNHTLQREIDRTAAAHADTVNHLVGERNQANEVAHQWKAHYERSAAQERSAHSRVVNQLTADRDQARAAARQWRDKFERSVGPAVPRLTRQRDGLGQAVMALSVVIALLLYSPAFATRARSTVNRSAAVVLQVVMKSGAAAVAAATAGWAAFQK